MSSRPAYTPGYLAKLFATFLGVLLFILYGLIPPIAAWQVTHPNRTPLPADVTPADAGLVYEDALFETADGLALRGWFFPGRNGAGVLAVHGYTGNRLNVFDHVYALARAGYSVLAFDMRAHGASDGEVYAVAFTHPADGVAALDWLAARPEVAGGRLGGVGLSDGANLLLRTAGQDRRLAAVWADGAGPGGVNAPPLARAILESILWLALIETPWFTGEPLVDFPEAAASTYPTPLMLVSAAGLAFESGPNQAMAAAANASLWEVESGHTTAMFTHPDEYTHRMLDFFATTLLD